MKLTSFGAAEGVTGSCHLLEVGSKRILLECGMFQGRGSKERNEPPMPFDPRSIDQVVISHAHLDHIGRIPLLVKEGYRGPIISTRATFDLARISLLDSANLQETEARNRNKRRKEGDPEVKPLYDDQDVLDAIEQWNVFVPYHQPFEVCDGVTMTFHDAGHILGSAFLELELEEDGESVRVLFSGDLGNVNKPIIKDPEAAPQADVVMVESTYGDRDHRDFDSTIEELEAAIRETCERGGNVIIPTFALERAQELLYVLYEAWTAERIPRDVRIFLDSPMAISATRIFERHPDLYDREAIDLHESGKNPFEFSALTYTRPTRESMAINHIRKGAVILAGSGMVTGGRVLHHLKHNLMRPECSVVFCGFQVSGTLGRRIVDGADWVTIYGQSIQTNAQIYTINGFSAHAGQEELTEWVRQSGAKKVLLVHGEAEKKEVFARHLHTELELESVESVRLGEGVELLS